MVPRYIFGQVLGAFVGAFIIYANYMRAIHQYDPDKLIFNTGGNASASLFVTVPNSAVSGTGIGFAQCAVLLLWCLM